MKANFTNDHLQMVCFENITNTKLETFCNFLQDNIEKALYPLKKIETSYYTPSQIVKVPWKNLEVQNSLSPFLVKQ